MGKLRNLRVQVFALVATSFVLGFSEFVMVGILNDIANQLHTPVSTIGYLVTLFAVICAFSTPVIAAIIGHWNLYKSMILLMVIFIVGNIMSAVANSYNLLLVSRIVTALVSGVTVSVQMTFANYIAPGAKRSRLVAAIYSGFSIASVIGVPLGTWISVHFGWKNAFWFISILSILTLILLSLCLPTGIIPPKSNIFKQLSLLKDKRILVGMWLPMFNLAAVYPLYTYLRPILSTQLHFSTDSVTLILFLYGFTSIISNQISGRLAEHKNGLYKMVPIYAVLSVVLFIFPFILSLKALAIILIMLIGVEMYIVSSPIAIYYLDIAENDYPQSILLASSINSIFANLGIALGSATGSVALNNMGLISVGPSGIIYVILAIIIVLIIRSIVGVKYK